MRTLATSILIAAIGALGIAAAAAANAPTTAAGSTAPNFDAALAQRLGADEHGMRSYVLVILKTGPTPTPKGDKRNEMFKGHFANIQRLASAGKLAAAGPFDGADGWRGMFIFAVKDVDRRSRSVHLAVKDVDEAKALTATDPVIQSGEMIAEYHPLYSSAALMLVNETHAKLARQPL